jgi:hypothetical protein
MVPSNDFDKFEIDPRKQLIERLARLVAREYVLRHARSEIGGKTAEYGAKEVQSPGRSKASN